MRPNQNNKNRQRGGRNNNNGGRKHINPLSRSFESNGPDVKVRGNAAHIAEKYLQLARDAQSSGDPVLAENYLQHAEHYFRIVATAQAQSAFRADPANQQPPEVDEDDDFPPINDRFASPEPRVPFQQQPQQGGGMLEAQEGEQAPMQQPSGEGEQAEDGQQQSGQGQQGERNFGDRNNNRERHRRRRNNNRNGNGEGNQGGNGNDPGGAPQPDVGELPAFLTAGGTTTVAE